MLATHKAVNPEVVDSFEVGVKSEWNDNLRVNATAFYLDHKDRQFVTVLPSEDNSALSQRLGNIGKSTASGLELEIEYAATDSLNLFANVGLIDSSFSEVISFDADLNKIDISDNFTITNTPETTANLGFSYDIETSAGAFVVNGNYYYRSDYDLNVTEYLVGNYAFLGEQNTDGSYAPGLGGDTTLIGYYGDPETISLTIGYSF